MSSGSRAGLISAGGDRPTQTGGGDLQIQCRISRVRIFQHSQTAILRLVRLYVCMYVCMYVCRNVCTNTDYVRM